jgi:hypothetical protein
MRHAVFVNYRVGDQDTVAALIAKVLRDQFGQDRVFQASTSIRPSEPFPEKILEAVRGAAVLLAVIGERWQPQTWSEPDWVRREIAEAITANVSIIPVLIGAIRPMRDSDLPDDIKALANLQYMRMHYRSVSPDVSNLIRELVVLAPALQPEANTTDPPPIHVLDAPALQGGFHTLWSRLLETLGLAASGAGGPVADPAVVASWLGDLVRLRDDLTPYAHDSGLIEPLDATFRSRLARLRGALEAVFGERFLLPGESIGTRVVVRNDTKIIGVGGRSTAFRAPDPSGFDSVDVTLKRHRVDGIDNGVVFGYPPDPS